MTCGACGYIQVASSSMYLHIGGETRVKSAAENRWPGRGVSATTVSEYKRSLYIPEGENNVRRVIPREGPREKERDYFDLTLTEPPLPPPRADNRDYARSPGEYCTLVSRD